MLDFLGARSTVFQGPKCLRGTLSPALVHAVKTALGLQAGPLATLLALPPLGLEARLDMFPPAIMFLHL